MASVLGNKSTKTLKKLKGILLYCGITFIFVLIRELGKKLKFEKLT